MSAMNLMAYSLAAMALPPSTVIVAPFTNAPARLLKNKQAPATSCGVPMRPRGTPALIDSPNSFNVAAIILLSKGPQANVLELQVELVSDAEDIHKTPFGYEKSTACILT